MHSRGSAGRNGNKLKLTCQGDVRPCRGSLAPGLSIGILHASWLSRAWFHWPELRQDEGQGRRLMETWVLVKLDPLWGCVSFTFSMRVSRSV